MSKQIMVIDDDESYVYLLRRKLKSLDEEVSFTSYPTGKEALDYFTSLPRESILPDLVILDLNMPVMDGFHFLDSFRKFCDVRDLKKPPPVLLIATSSDDPHDRARIKEYKIADDYLVKPIKLERIALALRAV